MLGHGAAQNTLRGKKHPNRQGVTRCQLVSLAAGAALDVGGKVCRGKCGRLRVSVHHGERLSGGACTVGADNVKAIRACITAGCSRKHTGKRIQANARGQRLQSRNRKVVDGMRGKTIVCNRTKTKLPGRLICRRIS